MKKEDFYNKIDELNVFKVVKHICKKEDNSTIAYIDILNYFIMYAKIKAVDSIDNEMLFKIVTASLMELSSSRKIFLKYNEDDISEVHYPFFDVLKIKRAYLEVEEKGKGYPSKEYSKFSNVIVSSRIELEDLFEMYRDQKTLGTFEEKIYSIKLGNDIKRILVYPALVDSFLIKASVALLKTNLKHIEQSSIKEKLETFFANEKNSVNSFLATLDLDNKALLKKIKSPSEDFIKFFSTYSSILYSEYKHYSTEKASTAYMENACASSIVILEYMNFLRKYIKTIIPVDTLYKICRKYFNEKPFFYMLNNILSFKNEDEVRVSSLFDEKDVEKLLTENDSIGTLRLTLEEEKQLVFYLKKIIPIYLLTMANEIKDNFGSYYKEAWVQALDENKVLNTMITDSKFNENINYRIKLYHPILREILNYDFLNDLISHQTEIGKKQKKFLNSFLNHEIKEIDFIAFTKLDRQNLYKYAKDHRKKLFAIPFIGPLLRMLFYKDKDIRSKIEYEGQVSIYDSKKGESAPKKINRQRASYDNVIRKNVKGVSEEQDSNSIGKNVKGVSEEQDSNNKSQVSREAKIEAIGKEIMGDNYGKDVDAVLETLERKWNPLVEEEKREQLSEDIKMLGRDLVKNLQQRNHFLPEANLIKLSVDKIASDKKLLRIKNKNEFRKYMEIFIYKNLK